MTVLAPPSRFQASPQVVGLLCDSLGDPYSSPVMHGAVEKLTREGCHTVCLGGGFPAAPFYRGDDGALAVPTVLDGMILLSATLREAGREIEQMTAQSTKALVSIGAEMPNASHISVNDETGVFQAVAHLVKRHDRRRIAFIAGPEGSIDGARRLAAYQIALETFKLTRDSALVLRGDFEARSGREAVFQLLRFGTRTFDALVAANDLMALGAIDGLKAGNVRVPEDVAVVGFDDLPEAQFASPSLTTVRQPVYEQGVSSAQLVLRRLRGDMSDEPTTIVPAPLVIRQSCGCDQVTPPPPTPTPNADAREDQEILDDTLRGLLRKQLTARRVQRELSRMAESIVAANDLPELASVLTGAFRLLGIHRLLVCAYTGNQRRAHVVLESSGREVVFRNKSGAFPVTQLLPVGFLGRGKPSQLLVEPLKIGDEHYGYLVIEADLKDSYAHLDLRLHLSSALGRIERARELRRLYAEDRKGARAFAASPATTTEPPPPLPSPPSSTPPPGQTK